MTVLKAGTDTEALLDPEKGAAGKEPAAEQPFFVSPFRERVLYAYFTVQLVGLFIVDVAMFILWYTK